MKSIQEHLLAKQDREYAVFLRKIYGWLQSEQIYTVRFGIGMLMQHFLDALNVFKRSKKGKNDSGI